MKEYYKLRWHWIFNYTSKNFGYCLLKTLCLIVGLPIYSVMFVLEMVLTGINMIFCWIPILNTVVLVICKSLMIVFGSTFYICVLTDLKEYNAALAAQKLQEEGDAPELQYEILNRENADDNADANAADDTNAED